MSTSFVVLRGIQKSDAPSQQPGCHSFDSYTIYCITILIRQAPGLSFRQILAGVHDQEASSPNQDKEANGAAHLKYPAPGAALTPETLGNVTGSAPLGSKVKILDGDKLLGRLPLSLAADGV